MCSVSEGATDCRQIKIRETKKVCRARSEPGGTR